MAAEEKCGREMVAVKGKGGSTSAVPPGAPSELGTGILHLTVAGRSGLAAYSSPSFAVWFQSPATKEAAVPARGSVIVAFVHKCRHRREQIDDLDMLAAAGSGTSQNLICTATSAPWRMLGALLRRADHGRLCGGT
jgi:hypothetical protein